MIVKKYLVINSRGSVVPREKEPTGLKGNEVAVRLEIVIPDALFKRPLLRASLTIPNSAVPNTIIDANVADNVAELIKQATGLEMTVSVVPFENKEEDKE